MDWEDYGVHPEERMGNDGHEAIGQKGVDRASERDGDRGIGSTETVRLSPAKHRVKINPYLSFLRRYISTSRLIAMAMPVWTLTGAASILAACSRADACCSVVR